MPERDVAAATWDALTYDGSAPGRNVPSLHIYIKPGSQSGTAPDAARRLFQDLISRFYSGPPFLAPAEKLADTISYALEQSHRNSGFDDLDRTRMAVAIIDKTECELHLFRQGNVVIFGGEVDSTAPPEGGFETVEFGEIESLIVVDGDVPREIVAQHAAGEERGRVIIDGATSGLRIALSNDWESGAVDEYGRNAPGEDDAEIIAGKVAASALGEEGEAAPAASAGSVEFAETDLHAIEEMRPAKTPLLPLGIVALVLVAAVFWKRQEGAPPPDRVLGSGVNTTAATATGTGAIDEEEWFSAAGDIVWDRTAEAAVTSSPAADHHGIVVGSRDGYLYSIDHAGRLRWKSPGPGGIGSSPAIDGDRVYFGEYGGSIVCVDLQTGQEIWRTATSGKIVSSPLSMDGVVYIGSHDRYLYAVEGSTGELLWKFRAGDSIWSSPEGKADLVFIASLDRNLYALNRSDGSEKWKLDLGAPIYGSPTIAGADLFIGNRNGDFFRIAAEDGTVIWRVSAGTSIHSTAAVADDRLVVGIEDGTVVCLSRATGDFFWSFPTGQRVTSSPVIDRGMAYFGSYDRYFYALDLEGGHPVWRVDLGSSIYSSPALYENTLYVGTNIGRIAAISVGLPD